MNYIKTESIHLSVFATKIVQLDFCILQAQTARIQVLFVRLLKSFQFLSNEIILFAQDIIFPLEDVNLCLRRLPD